MNKEKQQKIVRLAFVTDTDGIYINPMSQVVDSSIEPKDSFQYDLETFKDYYFRLREKKDEIAETRQRKSRKLAKLDKRR